MTGRHATFTLPLLYGTPGGVDDYAYTPRVCALCQKPIKHAEPSSDIFADPGPPADQVILSARHGTVHAHCYPASLAKQELREAWATIALDLAQRPSKVPAAQLRAALTQLARYALDTGKS